MKKEYVAVAYHAMQYAPALCIWREKNENDAISYGIIDYTRVGYMNDAGQPGTILHWSRIEYNSKGAYIRHKNRRYYLHDFIKF